MLYKLLMKSLSDKVTLKYVITSRVLQKLSKECQPMAPNLFFRLISCHCIFDVSSKLSSETNLFVKGIRHFVRLFLIPNTSLYLGSYITTQEWQFFSPLIWKKNEKVCDVSSWNNFLSKSVKNFHHSFDIAQNQGQALVRMLNWISVCKNTMF